MPYIVVAESGLKVIRGLSTKDTQSNYYPSDQEIHLEISESDLELVTETRLFAEFGTGLYLHFGLEIWDSRKIPKSVVDFLKTEICKQQYNAPFVLNDKTGKNETQIFFCLKSQNI